MNWAALPKVRVASNGEDLATVVADLSSDGGMVYIPAGVTVHVGAAPAVITAPPTVRQRIVIRGAGPTSRIEGPGTPGDHKKEVAVLEVRGWNPTSKSAQDITIEDLTIDGCEDVTRLDRELDPALPTPATGYVIGIRLDRANNIVRIRNVTIVNCGAAGIALQQISVCNVYESLVIRNCGTGIRCTYYQPPDQLSQDFPVGGDPQGSNSLSILGCLIRDCALHGIRIVSGTQYEIADCQIEECCLSGISLSYVSSALISGCRLVANGWHPRHGGAQIWVGNPTAYYPETKELSTVLASCSGVVVRACSMRGQGRSLLGILNERAKGTFVGGNHFEGHTVTPLRVRSRSAHTTVLGNSYQEVSGSHCDDATLGNRNYDVEIGSDPDGTGWSPAT